MQNRDVIEEVLTVEPKTLEFTGAMTERNDTIDNAVYDCILTLAEKDDEGLPWDMQIIGDVTDAIKDALLQHGFHVRYPGIVTEPDGSQHYEE